MHNILPLMVLWLMVAACASGYKVEGTSSITSLDGKTLYLRTVEDGEWVDVDSAEVLHGRFKMTGEADTVRMVTLYMGNESIMPLVLETGDVNVSIAAGQLAARGTPLNDRLYDFIARRNEFETKIGELDRREARQILEGANPDEIHAQVMEEGEALLKEMNIYIKQFIRDNFDNVLGPSVFMMMCNTLPYPVMTDEIEELMRTAPASFKENELVRDFLDKAKENMKLIEEQQRLQENAAVEAAKQGR